MAWVWQEGYYAYDAAAQDWSWRPTGQWVWRNDDPPPQPPPAAQPPQPPQAPRAEQGPAVSGRCRRGVYQRGLVVQWWYNRVCVCVHVCMCARARVRVRH